MKPIQKQNHFEVYSVKTQPYFIRGGYSTGGNSQKQRYPIGETLRNQRYLTGETSQNQRYVSRNTVLSVGNVIKITITGIVRLSGKLMETPFSLYSPVNGVQVIIGSNSLVSETEDVSLLMSFSYLGK